MQQLDDRAGAHGKPFGDLVTIGPGLNSARSRSRTSIDKGFVIHRRLFKPTARNETPGYGSVDRRRALTRAGDGSQTVHSGWCAQRLPLTDVAMKLLEADDAEIARRFLRDKEGGALDDFRGQLKRLGAHLADEADAL